jgi:phosphoglycerate dehydrogenase-like enzyme
MNESTIGVIGVGAIGSAVLQRAAPFGANLLGYDIREIDSELVSSTGVRPTRLKDLLAQSDYVSINCDLTKTSFHLMNDEAFALMRPHAVIVNAARGPIIDEKALVRALESGHVGGAALDVFEDEPLSATSPLRQMNNVMIAPHNSNSSATAWERVHFSTLDQLVSVLRELT